MSDNRELEKLRGDIEAAEIAIKSYQDQEKHLKAIAELAVKALKKIYIGNHSLKVTAEDIAKSTLEEINLEGARSV